MTDGKLGLTPEEIDTIRAEYLQPAKRNGQVTDGEVRAFIHQCERTGLSPFDRQIYARWNKDKDSGTYRMGVQSTIDGFRAVAERSGKYLGQEGPWWQGPDRKWLDSWIEDDAPKAAKVGVWKQGSKTCTYAVAHFKEFAQRTSGGTLTFMWRNMPANQLAKCAEALALRRVFPNELSGLYTTEEMEQAVTPDDAQPTREELARAATLDSAPVKTDGRDPNRKPIPPGTLPPQPKPAEEKPARNTDAQATREELDALRDLIKAAGVSEPYIRMVLIEFGIEDVATVEEMLPKLTVGQALHVMTRINERAGIS